MAKFIGLEVPKKAEKKEKAEKPKKAEEKAE